MSSQSTPEETDFLAPQIFADALIEAGVFTKADVDNYITRVVIVAEPDNPVKVYVEKIGDRRILNLAAILVGAEVVYAKRGKPDASPRPGD